MKKKLTGVWSLSQGFLKMNLSVIQYTDWTEIQAKQRAHTSIWERSNAISMYMMQKFRTIWEAAASVYILHNSDNGKPIPSSCFTRLFIWLSISSTYFREQQRDIKYQLNTTCVLCPAKQYYENLDNWKAINTQNSTTW